MGQIYNIQNIFNPRPRMHKKNSPVTTEQVIQSYKLLSSDDPQAKHAANQFLCNVAYRDEAWQITQNMLNNVQDPNFQFLGTQILYQKVSHQLLALSPEARNELREFVFTKLQDTTIVYGAILDKLASIAALIACIALLESWPSFVQDMIGFMSKSEHNLKSGLYVLERIPEELRATSRIAAGLKNNIFDDLLKHEKALADVFMSVLNMNNNALIKRCLQAMESWAKSRFNFLKYTELIKKVLIQSLQSFQKFESGIVMVVETIKSASSSRFTSSLSEWEPQKQLTKYSASQIQSIKLIIQFIIENKNNFLSSTVEAEHIDMYLEIIKNSLLSFGFLVMEKIGFDMLQIILHFTKSADLRTSQGTFQFWMDFSDKMVKCKIAEEVRKHFALFVEQVFEIVSRKVKVDYEPLLDDPDLKQDLTIDDINAMSFSEYRRESSTLFQCLYTFYLNYTGSSKYYFDKCLAFIGDEATGSLGKGTQLALFCVKAAIESMLTPQDAEFLCGLLAFVIGKGTNVYARIVVEVLFLIRDCTRQIKSNNELCLNALNYSLHFLSDQKICFYAAEAFKILMQTLTTISDPSIVANMLKFYSSQEFPNEQIIDKVIEGIMSTIMRMGNKELIGHYIRLFVGIVLEKFQKVHQQVQAGLGKEKPYLVPLKEFNTVLESFQGFDAMLRSQFQPLYQQSLAHGLKIVQITIPYCLKQKQNYTKFNQTGLSCAVYKQTLKLYSPSLSQKFLSILDTVLSILTPQLIVDMCPILEIVCYTIVSFVPKTDESFDKWLIERVPFINGFFLTFMDPIGMADCDVIRYFYDIQEGLILYNCPLYLTFNTFLQIFDLALYVLRHVNEPKMQRKVVSYLYLCSQISELPANRYAKLIEVVLSSIPIVSSLSHHNLSRILLSLCPKTPNIPELLSKSLQSNPYDQLQKQTSHLFLQLLLLLISPNLTMTLNSRERNLMMVIKDLQEFAKLGEAPGKVTQLEFRLAMWKKNKGTGVDDD